MSNFYMHHSTFVQSQVKVQPPQILYHYHTAHPPKKTAVARVLELLPTLSGIVGPLQD
jgi:hypothetical protein